MTSKSQLQAPADMLVDINRALTRALAPCHIELRDETRRHSRHREAAGRFHLALRVVSPRFEGLNQITRHRLVNSILADLLAGPLHALRLITLTPDEAQVREQN